MARVSRHEARDVLGKPLLEVIPEVRHTRLPDVIEDSLRVGSSSILTHTLNALLPLQGESGEPLLHNIVVRPVSSVHTNYCLLQVTDVTVAVTRERVLRERQNARYHAIVDSAPDAIVTIDDNRDIQWVNGAVDHVLGYSHAELLGQKLDILLDSEQCAPAKRWRRPRSTATPATRYRLWADTRTERPVTLTFRWGIGGPINGIS